MHEPARKSASASVAGVGASETRASASSSGPTMNVSSTPAPSSAKTAWRRSGGTMSGQSARVAPLSGATRALWPDIVPPDRRHAVFALEGAGVELTFIVGPLLLADALVSLAPTPATLALALFLAGSCIAPAFATLYLMVSDLARDGTVTESY